MDAQSLYPMNICYRYFDLEEFFASCARLGLHSAELWLCPQHVLVNGQFSEGPARLLRLMDAYGVRLACLCGEQNNPKPNNIAARGELLVSNTRSYFEKVIDLAQATSCPKVLVTPGWNYYDEPVECARERSVAMLRRLADYAAERGVDLVLESIWTKSSEVGPDIASLALIKERVNRDNLLVTIDFGAMSAAGETVDDWFEAFGDDVAHCHFVDGTPTGHMPWGHGELDMLESLRAFERHGYRGGFSLEYVHPMSFRDPESYVRETRELYEGCLAQLAHDKNSQPEKEER